MTNKERLEIYKKFLHHIALMYDLGEEQKVIEALKLIGSWSYAHRRGNGEYSEYEQQKLVDNMISKMKDIYSYEDR